MSRSTLDVRRHSTRGPDGSLTRAGRALADRSRRLLLPNYDRIWSSPKTRAIQTAESFGWPDPIVDARLGLPPSKITDGHDVTAAVARAGGRSLLQVYFALPDVRDALREFGRRTAAVLLELATTLPDGGAGLVVSHGSTIEPLALAAMGGPFELERLGGEFSECEGVRLVVDNGSYAGVDLIRSAD